MSNNDTLTVQNWQSDGSQWHDTTMTTSCRVLAFSLTLIAMGSPSCRAVELKVGRDTIQRTLKRQLFSGPDSRYYLKGDAKTACSVYADDAQLSFVKDRIVVR